MEFSGMHFFHVHGGVVDDDFWLWFWFWFLGSVAFLFQLTLLIPDLFFVFLGALTGGDILFEFLN